MRDVLSYFSWISAGKMIGALGLAKTTTWPLIPMTAFAALLTEFAQGELEHALAEQVPSAWSCRVYIPVSELIYAAFRSNAKGLLLPSDE